MVNMSGRRNVSKSISLTRTGVIHSVRVQNYKVVLFRFSNLLRSAGSKLPTTLHRYYCLLLFAVSLYLKNYSIFQEEKVLNYFFYLNKRVKFHFISYIIFIIRGRSVSLLLVWLTVVLQRRITVIRETFSVRGNMTELHCGNGRVSILILQNVCNTSASSASNTIDTNFTAGSHYSQIIHGFNTYWFWWIFWTNKKFKIGERL